MGKRPISAKMISRKGQTTVEAAVALPVLLILVLMLVQPAIMLYDRMVMESAAWEGCRLLATAQSQGKATCEALVKRRLGPCLPWIASMCMREGARGA